MTENEYRWRWVNKWIYNHTKYKDYMNRIGLWNDTDHITWLPRKQFHWISRKWHEIITAWTFIWLRTVTNGCPCAQKEKDKIKILNSHDANILFLVQAYNVNMACCLLKNLTVFFSPSTLHLLPFMCDIKWRWCDYMPLLLPDTMTQN